MFIKSVNWIDEESQEAEVVVSDNSFELLCFSHPFRNKLGEELIEPIYCFDVSNVVLAFEQIPYAKKNKNSYGYSIRGLFINKDDKIVLIGNIKLCLEDGKIPSDISEGEYIEFDVSRLDVY
ncbi:hypothetical protein [Clostridium formicaceticum]|uniref:Uncharacterized protein n=1 Tax=Clostridium formicaceticum TaxID=1497 RepID=A0AAC9RJ36_9CLOT|nr:hypothetical protein [Clostridium formicaceticum]AOY76022.1 hypothetical protein BJL90_08990 [Clostridium formicaceticum]ARE86380.1 hypothetical protein CLFO_07020 [Clostridium formicaceticum]